MERNEQTLSTRDLASTDDPGADAVSTPERGGESADSPPAEVHDRGGESADSPPAEVHDRGGESADSPPAEVHDQAGTPPAREPADAQETGAEPATDRPVPEADPSSGEPLLTPELGATFQRRWEEVQTRFVDEPRGAVEQADGLVANLMQQLADGFAKERERLEAQWDRGEDISTEDLRVALQRYRSFFQRLLST